MTTYYVSFVHHDQIARIEANTLTQAKRIASRRWNKMNIRSVWLAV